MPNINILDKSIYSLISAGEVVERPASVVKELVENSIDADAKIITIEIKTGGIERIKVTDNGCGISFSDLPKAFLPHATSKIATKEDLEKIGTLGFRGEALSSIAVVSKVSVISKVADFAGNKIVIHGGETLTVEPSSSADGTTIIVDDIFYNVPARAKFLKKPKQEESEITNYVARLILANPEISIKYIADEKLIYQTHGNGLYEAIYGIYGKGIVDNLIKIDHNYKNYKLVGFVGKPSFAKPNRTYQTLIVNGRYVINQTVSTAAYKAFENYLMKGNFPFYVLNIYLPNDALDVNVHPNKLDVKFENSNDIFMLVLNALSEALFNANNIVNVANDKIERDLDLSKLQKIVDGEGIDYVPNSDKVDGGFVADKNDIKVAEVFAPRATFDEKYNEKLNQISTFLIDDKYEFNQVNQPSSVMEKLFENSVQNLKMITDENKLNQEAFPLNLTSFKIVGTVFNTYVIIEKGDRLLFIDQHAAHERILFDKFSKELKNKEIITQPMIVPFVFDVNTTEFSFLENNLNNLKQLGFDIEPFGFNSFKISSTPHLFKNIDLQAFITSLLSDIQTNLNLSSFDLLSQYLAKKACRSAVKANDILSIEEIELLLEQLQNKVETLLCPHGRPIIVNVTNKDIEKWFKRTL